MFENLYKNLALNKKLILPSIGIFTIEQQSAELDFVTKTLHAALPVIRFTVNKNEVSESVEFNNAANEIKNNCAAKGNSFLPGIGKIKKEFLDYSFEPKSSLQGFFPDIIVERIVRKDAQHTIRVGEEERSSTEMQQFYSEEKIVKDKWWAYAIILALFGIIALIVYNILT